MDEPKKTPLQKNFTGCEEPDCRLANTLIFPRILRLEGYVDHMDADRRTMLAAVETLRAEQAHHGRRISLLESGLSDQHIENHKVHAQIASLRSDIGSLRTEITSVGRSVHDTQGSVSRLHVSLDTHLGDMRAIMTDLAAREITDTQRRERAIRLLLWIGAGVTATATTLIAIHATLTGQSLLQLVRSVLPGMS